MSAPILNQPLSKKISPKTRELMFRVMDGQHQLAPVMYMMHQYKFCENFLTWMIHHKWTGKHLHQILVKQFGSSVPRMVDYMVGAINKFDINAMKESKSLTRPTGIQ